MGKVEMLKKIKDEFGDTAIIESERHTVSLSIKEDGFSNFLELSPKQARKVARALREAARKVEAGRVLADIDRSFD